ncbi:nitronate monooxygenase, partial [Mycolicibacterium llatzerense]
LAHGTPVLAAGGIGDGRGLAAALTLGAAGAMIGTRFEATHESLLSAAESKVMLKATAEDTTTGRAIDIAARPLETRWPATYPARTLRSVFTDQWQDRDAELDADPKAQEEFRDRAAKMDLDYVPIWAGEALDLIDELELAAPLVQKIAHDAEQALTRAHTYIR